MTAAVPNPDGNIVMGQPNQPPQPDPQYVIATLMEENAAANQNRLYLMAMLKQVQAEFAEERAMWELERESLLAGRSTD